MFFPDNLRRELLYSVRCLLTFVDVRRNAGYASLKAETGVQVP